MFYYCLLAFTNIATVLDFVENYKLKCIIFEQRIEVLCVYTGSVAEWNNLFKVNDSKRHTFIYKPFLVCCVNTSF